MAKKKTQPVDPDRMNKPYERRGRGAPTKLTPELQTELCKVVELCNSLEDAASFVGLARTTVFMWQQKGREQARGVYRDFLDAVDAAKARRRVNANAQLLMHGKRDWRALLAVMERTDPKHFALQIKVQVNEELEGMMDKLRENLTPQEYERALAAISSADDSGEAPGGHQVREDAGRSGLAAGVGAAVVAALSEPATPE